jgi:hypothetical protein
VDAIVQRILSTDKNSDGKLAKDETSDRLQSAFDEIDTNKDGFLDADELKARITARMRRGPQAGPGGPGRRGPGDRGPSDRRRGRGPEGRPDGPPPGDAPAAEARPDGGSVDGRSEPVTMKQTAADMWQVFVAPWL